MTFLIRLFVFLMIVSVSVCCENKESSKVTQNRVVQVKNEESKIQISQNCPECYSKSDLDSLDETTFHSAMKKISDLKEVIERSEKYPGQIIYCMIETDSNDVYQSNAYLIKVMLETETHYSTQFNFYVDKQMDEIKILDTVRDTLLFVSDWRKTE